MPSLADPIYVIEDDAEVARLIISALRRYDFNADHLSSGRAALDRIRQRPPALCILDLGLPDMDGFEVLRQIRSEHRFGLLVLTGRGDTFDRVTGLELGADDYMVKPFEPRELIARVRSILRRYTPDTSTANTRRIASFAGWRFDTATHELTTPEGLSQALALAEANLLKHFLAHPNQILSREQLLDDRSLDALDRSIDLRVSRLRKRFDENPQHNKLIRTVYGAGYLFCCDVHWSSSPNHDATES